jgi:hypothetical protein
MRSAIAAIGTAARLAAARRRTSIDRCSPPNASEKAIKYPFRTIKWWYIVLIL